jgi:2-amino-4-hydroxy-6-hydroxymethyldihydropteridine diphosphokinase
VPRFVLLLGANENAEHNLGRALALIERQFGLLRIGLVFRSPDRDGDDRIPPYLNQALEIASPLDAPALKNELRTIEAQCGRVRPAVQPGLCPMDIDLALVYELPHWRVLDHKAVAPAYAQQALLDWRAES